MRVAADIASRCGGFQLDSVSHQQDRAHPQRGGEHDHLTDHDHQRRTGLRRIVDLCPAPTGCRGNPACFYSDGWQANSGGPGIEIWYFHEPQNLSKPDKVTAIVRKNDGTDQSQEAAIEAGQQTHRFEFPAIDKSAVQEVLLSSSTGRCYVIGPGN
ncbi:hypothetical protein [Mycobacterium sherrisii]|uniref:hypothetical protein n=1 Tax=Mycobacterium sherrisii TaxID=243061 RepID=UPI001E38DAD1|nr:hypothetical protein [Mycobacterium sherrisii]MEC4763416.1 hypothetical protein [Mycobacterium sherrisii]